MTEEEEPQCANHQQSEQQTIECILKQEKSAAAIVCSIKIHQLSQSSKLPFTKDVLGVVATLGKVMDDNFSRLLFSSFHLYLLTVQSHKLIARDIFCSALTFS